MPRPRRRRAERQRRRRLLLPFLDARDVEFGYESVEVGAADVEAARGGGAIAAFGLQGRDDHATTERDGCAFERRLVRRGGRLPCAGGQRGLPLFGTERQRQ